MRKTFLFGLIAALVTASNASAGSPGAQIVINEVLGSTTGADTEFIELFNIGPLDVDISGWLIEEIESDATSNGTVDDSWTINAGTILPAGGFFLLGNPAFETAFGIISDQTEPLSIENSSYTLLLSDSLGAPQFSAFVNDGDGVVPTGITPDLSVGPFGPNDTEVPPGFFLNTDGGTTASFLEFAPTPAASATPGSTNAPTTAIPEPSSMAALALLAGAGVLRRRR